MIGHNKRVIRLKVKEIAEAKGLSASRLSRKADVHYNTVMRIYKDPYHHVEINVLERLARALQVSIEALYEVEEDTD